MDKLITFLDRVFSEDDTNLTARPAEDIDNIETLTPADQAYRDYFVRRDLFNRKLNLIA